MLAKELLETGASVRSLTVVHGVGFIESRSACVNLCSDFFFLFWLRGGSEAVVGGGKGVGKKSFFFGGGGWK